MLINLFCTFIVKEKDLAPEIVSVEWLPNTQLNVTVQSPQISILCQTDDLHCGAPTAIGHFTFDDHNGNSYRFSKHADFVNGYNDSNCCDYGTSYVGQNPYNYVVSYDFNQQPSHGSTVTIALSIYYLCSIVVDIECFSCDVKYYSTYP